MGKEINLEDVIAGCLNNDLRQQEALYKWCYPDMMKVCLRYANDRDEAAELYNAAMFKVFRNIQSYQDEGKFIQWVRTVMINTCIDHVRAKAPLRLHEIKEDDTGLAFTEAEAFQHITAKEILALVRELPENIRMVFNLHAIEGYSHEEISKMLQIPAGTSRWYASEARKLLKRKMEKKFSTVKSLLND